MESQANITRWCDKKEVIIMSKTKSAAKEDVAKTVSRLLEISKLDTLYRDLYFQRAYELMEPILSYSTYTHMVEGLASVDWLEKQLRAAVGRSDWAKTRELTERIRGIQSSATIGGEWIRLGEALYEGADDIPIDPFSPGLHVFVGGSPQKLMEWKSRAIEWLSTLARTDAAKKDFYARRAADFQALSITAPSDQQGDKKEEKKESVTIAQLQQEALECVEAGNLALLDQLVLKIEEKSVAPEAKLEAKLEARPEAADTEVAEAVELGKDLLYEFSEATLAAASRLGLAPVRTKSRRQLAYLIPHGWQPSFLRDEIKLRSKDQLTRLLSSSGASNQVKDAIEFFLLNPFITSGGTRYQVCLVIEDLLLEDFAEPEPKQEMARTDLLLALGLESRWGLTRIDIEKALLRHGPRIVEEELALDPEAFRLVAIPPDLYTHLAAEHGWGQKQMWTHFDGYRVREAGKLQAVAGGDQRFGGTHDVMSFNPTYTNEKILTRFAVVQRRRMMTWHRR